MHHASPSVLRTRNTSVVHIFKVHYLFFSFIFETHKERVNKSFNSVHCCSWTTRCSVSTHLFQHVESDQPPILIRSRVWVIIFSTENGCAIVECEHHVCVVIVCNGTHYIFVWLYCSSAHSFKGGPDLCTHCTWIDTFPFKFALFQPTRLSLSPKQIFRHGDRNPIDTYPSDPHRKNHSHWPEGLKQLTNVSMAQRVDCNFKLQRTKNLFHFAFQIGKRQQFELGQFFGRRYKDLLGSARYASDLVYVQSTDDDRTQMSALCNLAGLFPPIESQIWNEDLLWQPIPVHSMPDLMDHLLSTNRPCPRYSYEKKKLKQSNKIRKLRKRLKPFLEFLTEKSGRKITSLFHVRKLYNTLYVEELKNLPWVIDRLFLSRNYYYYFITDIWFDFCSRLPEWTRSVYPDGEMKWIAEFSLKLPTYTPPMARLKSGFLLSDILNHSLKKSRGCKKLPQKLWMYSSHDTTIANMLNTLGSFEVSQQLVVSSNQLHWIHSAHS